MTTPFSQRLAQFVVGLTWDQLTPLRRKRLRWALADFVACTAAGASMDDARMAQILAHPGDVRVPGLRGGFTPDSAIVAMGTVGALLQSHDFYMPGSLHGSSTIVPTAWLLWDRERQPVSEILTALAAGYEIANRLGGPMLSGPGGAAPTSTLGAIGAVAVLSRLRGFDVKRTAAALSNAACFAPIAAIAAMAEHATVTPLHNGLAGRAGYEAVLMAEAGLDAGPVVFEGRGQGFLGFVGGAAARDTILALEPERWIGETIDLVLFKDLPACARNQAIVKAALGLVSDDDGVPLGAAKTFAPAEIKAIRIVTDARTASFDHTNGTPFGLYDRLMSYRWEVASTLIHGDYGLANVDIGPDEPPVADLMSRITVAVSDDYPSVPSGNARTGARVELDLAGGRTLAVERRLTFDLPLEAGWFTPYCTPTTTLDEAGMERKFFAYASRTLPTAEARTALDSIFA